MGAVGGLDTKLTRLLLVLVLVLVLLVLVLLLLLLPLLLPSLPNRNYWCLALSLLLLPQAGRTRGAGTATRSTPTRGATLGVRCSSSIQQVRAGGWAGPHGGHMQYGRMRRYPACALASTTALELLKCSGRTRHSSLPPTTSDAGGL